MHSERLHDGEGNLSAQAFRGNTPERAPQNVCASRTDGQDAAALGVALELIEARYEAHLAHMELQALLTHGELLCCL